MHNDSVLALYELQEVEKKSAVLFLAFQISTDRPIFILHPQLTFDMMVSTMVVVKILQDKRPIRRNKKKQISILPQELLLFATRRKILALHKSEKRSM